MEEVISVFSSFGHESDGARELDGIETFGHWDSESCDAAIMKSC